MMHRRTFLKATAAAATGGLLTACGREPSAASEAATSAPAHLDRIGVNLFTIPHLLEQDFAGAMAKLAGIGYKELEFFGPYPFSVPEVHARWNAVTGALGFTQSGYFGVSAREVRDLLDGHGLSTPSMHIDLDTLTTRLDNVAEAAHVLGQRYAGPSAIPAEKRQSLDGYKRTADEFNALGMRMQEVGLQLLYHNHGYGLVAMEGEIPLQVFIERTDPTYVVLEMDIYWTTAGGADPIAYLEAYPDHYRLMHIKDMTEVVRFEGDGGDPQQWIELFPYMADAGSGVLDLPRILATARRTGIRHFYLERDRAEDPDTTLQNSYTFLSTVDLDG